MNSLHLPSRLRFEWRLKCALSAALTLAFCVPYFTLQRLTLFPGHTLPPTPLDRAVTFQPDGWVYVYQSVYLLFPTTPWLATSREQLARYTRGFLCVSLVCFAFFFLLPVECPRPDDAPRDGMYGFLVSYDKTINTFPSGHVALAVFTVLFGRRIFGGDRRAGLRAFFAFEWLWVGLIAFSTLKTKQHFAVDLPAGALLAWAADAWAWRKATPSPLYSGERAGVRGSLGPEL
jgi:membrane-associated phospholipid phosphatase